VDVAGARGHGAAASEGAPGFVDVGDPHFKTLTAAVVVGAGVRCLAWTASRRGPNCFPPDLTLGRGGEERRSIKKILSEVFFVKLRCGTTVEIVAL
jgi:hypothetical protein